MYIVLYSIGIPTTTMNNNTRSSNTRSSKTFFIPSANTAWARNKAYDMPKILGGGTYIKFLDRDQSRRVNGQWQIGIEVSSWKWSNLGFVESALMTGPPSSKSKPSVPTTKAFQTRFSMLDSDEEEVQRPTMEEAEKAANLAGLRMLSKKEDDDVDSEWTVVEKTTKTTKTKKTKKKKAKTMKTVVDTGFQLVGGIEEAKSNDQERMVAIATHYAKNQEHYDAKAAARLTDGSWKPKTKGFQPEGLASCLFEWKDQGGVRYGVLRWFVKQRGLESFKRQTKKTDRTEKMDRVSFDPTTKFPTMDGKPLVKRTNQVTWGASEKIRCPVEDEDETKETETKEIETKAESGTTKMVVLGGDSWEDEDEVTHDANNIVGKTLPMLSVTHMMDSTQFEEDDMDWEEQWDAAQTA